MLSRCFYKRLARLVYGADRRAASRQVQIAVPLNPDFARSFLAIRMSAQTKSMTTISQGSCEERNMFRENAETGEQWGFTIFKIAQRKLKIARIFRYSERMPFNLIDSFFCF